MPSSAEIDEWIGELHELGQSGAEMRNHLLHLRGKLGRNGCNQRKRRRYEDARREWLAIRSAQRHVVGKIARARAG